MIKNEASSYTQDLTFTPHNNLRLVNVCGRCDEHLKQIEQQLNVVIYLRNNTFFAKGAEGATKTALAVLKRLYTQTAHNQHLSPNDIYIALQQYTYGAPKELVSTDEIKIKTKCGIVKARTQNQKNYVNNIHSFDINFGIGPAGTGKTYLAVATAVEALEQEKVKRIILVRPAVEAGENLGFLPGDLSQKIDPYLRPLYDALYEMLGCEYVARLIERNIIEIAPLAYMRGRTLSDSFIILDESQNTTCEQMKMFLTRVGFGSKVVITGDTTQIDLPRGKKSGLIHAIEVLNQVHEIKFNYFKSYDVVRHPLVQSIIDAYEAYEVPKKKINEPID